MNAGGTQAISSTTWKILSFWTCCRFAWMRLSRQEQPGKVSSRQGWSRPADCEVARSLQPIGVEGRQWPLILVARIDKDPSQIEYGDARGQAPEDARVLCRVVRIILVLTCR